MKNNRHKKVDESRIYIENGQEKIPVKPEHLELIKETVMQCLTDEGFGIGCEINILLTDDESIQKLNMQYRDIDRPTDVLSFPMAEVEKGKLLSCQGDIDMDEGLLLLGDIIISLETALKQAEDYGHSFEREIAFLTSHGVFHLLGYDHIEKDDEIEMVSKQEAVLEKLGLRRK